jgi:S-formylglutathione hydrolase
MEQVSENKSFGGVIRKYKIASSQSLGGLESQFNVFLPKQAIEGSKVP